MIEQKIDALTAAIVALTEALLRNPPAQGAEQVKAAGVDAPEPIVTAPADDVQHSGPSEQDVKDLTLARSREGHKDAIRDKLAGFGAKKIGDLKGGQVSEFYDWLKNLGGN